MTSKPKVMVVAGEASGDLHSANLVHAFKKLRPDAEIYGIGGDRMQNAGVRLIRNISDLSTYGIFEVFKQIPRLAGVFFDSLNSIADERPDVVVLTDYPDFNIRLARAIRLKYGKKPLILYYIAPQVWIWRRKRAKVLAKLVDRLAVLLPFEKELFENLGAKVHFVGHPLLDADEKTKESQETVQPFQEGRGRKIALLPGSRHGELKSYMPPMMEAVRLLTEDSGNWQFVIVKAPTLDRAEFEPYLNESPYRVNIIEGPTQNILQQADFAVIALGTATLESALAATPALLLGKVSPLTSRFGILFLGMDLDYYSLVNFILERPAFPELIQENCTGPMIAEAVKEITNSERAIAALISAAQEVRSRLEVEPERDFDGNTASQRAAAILNKMLTERHQ